MILSGVGMPRVRFLLLLLLLAFGAYSMMTAASALFIDRSLGPIESFPIYEGAHNLRRENEILVYGVPVGVFEDKIRGFYHKELKVLGWQDVPAAINLSRTQASDALLVFQRGDAGEFLIIAIRSTQYLCGPNYTVVAAEYHTAPTAADAARSYGRLLAVSDPYAFPTPKASGCHGDVGFAGEVQAEVSKRGR